MSLDNLPVIVGVGEITQRSKDPAESQEPLALMEAALRAAEQDAGTALLHSADALDVVCEHSWPYADAPKLLAARLGAKPTHAVYATAGGESPVRLIHEAALRIARGESTIAAIAGAEANYTVAAAAKAGITLPWTPRDPQAKLLRGADICHPLAVRHGVYAPAHVYPFYENAALAAWGQSPAEAHEESARLWSRLSEVAQHNPHAWLRQRFSPDEVGTPNERNRLIAWPYTLRMVANPLVNMGAAVLLTSLGHARKLRIPAQRLAYVWGGAAAQEPRDYLARDGYARSHAQDAVLEAVRELAGICGFALNELYSCFPVVPKMARRTLGLGPDAALSSTGGLSFFGAPLNNYMTHAAAGLVHALRKGAGAGAGGCALLYGQGEFVTKHHALVLSANPPPAGTLAEDYGVQAAADLHRGVVPELVAEHAGLAQLETHTVVYDRDGAPAFGVVIARTPEGRRLMARVDAADEATLATLTDPARSPVGRSGDVTRGTAADAGPGLLHWKTRA